MKRVTKRKLPLTRKLTPAQQRVSNAQLEREILEGYRNVIRKNNPALSNEAINGRARAALKKLLESL